MNGRLSGRPWPEWCALAACIAASTGLLCWLLVRCRFGFEFTDEGYYLNWISSPGAYRASITQFGFVYHPLYKLLGGDIALLRQVNLIAIFGLSLNLCILLLRSLSPRWPMLALTDRAGFIGVSWVAASSALVYLEVWTPTPSYNSLTLEALLITATGVLLADRRTTAPAIAGWILIGLGGALAFLAKPTTAAVLGGLIACCIILSSKRSIGGLLCSLAAAVLFLVVFSLWVDGSPAAFLRRLVEGVDAYRLLLPESRLLESLRQGHSGLEYKLGSSLTYVMFVTYLATALALGAGNSARYIVAAMALLLAGLSAAIILGMWNPGISHEAFRPVVLSALPLALLLSAVLSRPDRLWSRDGALLVLLFAALPHAYAFGTNAGVWEAASRAAFFWVLAGLTIGVQVLAVNGRWLVLLPAAAASLFASAVILWLAMESPYRQTKPLRLQSSVVEINREGARLNVTAEVAAYVRDVRSLADMHGFKPGEAMLDLSGVSPGTTYVIGARSLGAAWLLAGYQGSNDFLTAMLGQESCSSIGAAWILTEPNSSDSFSSLPLCRFGIDIDNHYQDVGLVRSIRSFPPSPFEHHLLKPVRNLDTARLACEQGRRSQ